MSHEEVELPTTQRHIGVPAVSRPAIVLLGTTQSVTVTQGNTNACLCAGGQLGVLRGQLGAIRGITYATEDQDRIFPQLVFFQSCCDVTNSFRQRGDLVQLGNSVAIGGQLQSIRSN